MTTAGELEAVPPQPPAFEVLDALVWLDEVLARALVTAEKVIGVVPGSDPERGLYTGDDDASRLLERPPGAPLYRDPAAHGDPAVLPTFGARFALTAFERAVAVLALAPEIDLRYERLYGYLQDDVTRRRPTVELALDLLCRDAADKLRHRPALGADATLVRAGMLHLVRDPHHVEPPLLAHYLKLDDAVVRHLVQDGSIDPRIVGAAQIVRGPRAGDVEPGLVELARACRAREDPLTVCLRGRRGAARRLRAEALAAALGTQLLVLDAAAAIADEIPPGELGRIASLDARLRGALLYVDGLDAASATGDAKALLRGLGSGRDGPVMIIGAESRQALDQGMTRLVVVDLPASRYAERCELWAQAAAGAGCSRAEIESLAARFKLTEGEIADAVGQAVLDAACRRAPLDADGLLAAAQAQGGHALASLARRIEPRYRWGDIVLPADRMEQLGEIRDAVRHRAFVYDEWGFERQASLGKGIAVLFAGPSGTGKTMAAEILAGEVGLELFKIDLSTVVSKYIGETERNLAEIFREAETTSAVLFFDEADALFGKRSEVRDAHDRYANLEISYLLQRVEEHDGVVILATNLRKNMDDAFVRRVHYTVEFPFPGTADRRRIWQSVWPGELPRSADVDCELLASRFELTGGNIRNVALSAAFLAAADGRVVTMDHVLRATRREFQKMGNLLAAPALDHWEAAGAP